MAIKDRALSPIENARPSSFSCSYYSPKPGSKRCRHYLQNGACDRPDELMCVEWMKANNQSKPEQPSKEKTNDDVDRDLFGNPLPPRPKPVEKSQPEIAKPDPSEPLPIEAPLVRNLNDEEIASFKALGVEVCIKSDDVGEIWMVPEYTGQDRKEISVEHAATLSAVCAAFPGAKVASFEKTTEENSDSKKN
jgi:hypothetical protein